MLSSIIIVRKGANPSLSKSHIAQQNGRSSSNYPSSRFFLFVVECLAVERKDQRSFLESLKPLPANIPPLHRPHPRPMDHCVQPSVCCLVVVVVVVVDDDDNNNNNNNNNDDDDDDE